MGIGHSLAMACNLLATLAAAPLLAVGGYPLVGWSSVAVALLQAVLALSLPSKPRVVSTADDDDLAGRRHRRALRGDAAHRPG